MTCSKIFFLLAQLCVFLYDFTYFSLQIHNPLFNISPNLCVNCIFFWINLNFSTIYIKSQHITNKIHFYTAVGRDKTGGNFKIHQKSTVDVSWVAIILKLKKCLWRFGCVNYHCPTKPEMLKIQKKWNCKIGK